MAWNAHTHPPDGVHIGIVRLAASPRIPVIGVNEVQPDVDVRPTQNVVHTAIEELFRPILWIAACVYSRNSRMWVVLGMDLAATPFLHGKTPPCICGIHALSRALLTQFHRWNQLRMHILCNARQKQIQTT